ncbi:MAG: hypothetical protein ACTHJ5_11380 [Ilyomonas sp.]
MQQQLSQDEIIQQIRTAIQSLNEIFPEKITQNTLQDYVTLKFMDFEGEDGKKVCALHYSIKDVWEPKYDIPDAIAAVIVNKASELNVPVSRDPDITAAGQYNRSYH